MKKRLLYLDRLRFIAILSIILLHIIAIFRWKYFDISTSKYFLFTLLDSFTRIGVPIFFMLTGSLMFNKKDEKYKDFLKNRVLKLIVAYFFFCIIYYLYNNTNYSLYEFLRLSTSGSIEFHLWFMPVIIIIYMFIPFIKKIVLNINKKELLTMIILIFILGNCFIGIEAILGRFNYYLLGNFTLPKLIIYTNYLFIGYYLSNNEIKVDKKLIITSIISILLIPLFTVLVSNNEINDVFLDSVSPLVVLPTILIFTLLKNSKLKEIKFDNIIKNSINSILYVYLIHVLIIKIILKYCLFINNNHSLIIDILLIPLLFIIVTAISFLIIDLYRYIKNFITKNYNKIFKIIILLFNITFVIIYTIVLINLLLNPYNFIKLNYISLLICTIIYILIFYYLFKYKDIVFGNSSINYALIILYVIIQIVFAYMFIVQPSWDFGRVYEIAVSFAETKNPIFGASYLYLCENNIPIAVLFDILFKICHLIGLKSYLSIGVMFNIIMIDISLVYMYLLIDKINNKYSKPFIVFCLLFTPLIFYIPIFYTDTISMPFIIVPLYYFYKYFYVKDKILYIVISSLIFGLGTLIKPTVLIPAISIIIFILLFNKNKKLIPIIIVVLLIPIFGYKLFLNHFFITEYIEENSIPKNHYIMIGLEGNGGFSQDAYEYTVSIEDPIERKEMVNKRINKRINEMKNNHLFIKFYNQKISYTWTDGSFFALSKLKRFPVHEESIDTVNTKTINNLYWTISNFEWIIIIVLWISEMIFYRYLPTNLKEFNFVLSMSIFGLFLFLIIWETRSRYLINYIPLFMANSYIGLIAFINYIKKRGIINEK